MKTNQKSELNMSHIYRNINDIQDFQVAITWSHIIIPIKTVYISAAHKLITLIFGTNATNEFKTCSQYTFYYFLSIVLK